MGGCHGTDIPDIWEAAFQGFPPLSVIHIPMGMPAGKKLVDIALHHVKNVKASKFSPP